MTGRRYEFSSAWSVGVALSETWDFLTSPGQRWLDWWPYLREIHVRRTPQLVDSSATCWWRSPFGYSLVFTLTLVDLVPGESVTLRAVGDLHGHGEVVFREVDAATRISLRWEVQTTRRWMNLAAPVLHPVFRLGHDIVMRRGERGLRKTLEMGTG